MKKIEKKLQEIKIIGPSMQEIAEIWRDTKRKIKSHRDFIEYKNQCKRSEVRSA